jgi:diguanylate cyclase (GGDEF)-like protein
MSSLVGAAYAIRQTLSRAIPLAATTALGSAVVLPRVPVPNLYLGLGAGCLVALCVWRVGARKRALTEAEITVSDFELIFLALVAAVTIALRIDGHLDGPSYGAIYLVIGVSAAVARPLATALGLLALGGLEAGARLGPGNGDLVPLVLHLAFSSSFALLNHVMLRSEIVRLRSRAKAHVSQELERQQQAARQYRLVGAPRTIHGAGATQRGERGDEERLTRSSVEEIHQAVLFSLELVRRSMNLHTAMLLWFNDTGSHLRIAEVSTDGEVIDGPYLSGDGVLGAALSRKGPLSLAHLKPGYKLPYYGLPCPVGSVCVVPVIDHGEVLGLLVADRVGAAEFTPRDEETLLAATRHAVRAIQNERLFVQIERAKVEQGKLYRAAEALGGAVNEKDVVEAAVKSAREIASFDFAAVTVYSHKAREHEIRAVSGDGAEPLLGARFGSNNGLVSMVVQNLHPLPYKGEIEEKRQVVFSDRLSMPPVASVLVLPLIVHDKPLGTLVLGARRRGVFNETVRPTLEVLARHVAVSLANARMVKKLEDLATTDGLTGLLNKRALLDVAAAKLAAASRFNRKLSILVTDIDFFKKVNDTHGHDVGDVVIKGLGDVLRRCMRATDSVARFGGEEFVLVCEETDAKGAMQLAERIREELARTSFPTASGPLQVTCSLGVATFPEAGRDWESLFKSSDEALYASKHGGRNRSTGWTSALHNPPSKKHSIPAPAHP